LFPTSSIASIRWTKVEGSGEVTFGSATEIKTSADFTEVDIYVLRLTISDGEFEVFDEITIDFLGAEEYGLVPCGLRSDNDATPYNETAECESRHLFLLLRNLIDFVLWKATPVILVLMAIYTGGVFYFSWGGVGTLNTVRRIWRYIGIGAGVLLLSWLFLNFFLGILDFDISIFGQWTTLELRL